MRHVTLAIVAAFSLAACETTTSGTTQTDRTTQSGDFSEILDRPLTRDAGTVTINSNGTMTGELRGRAVNFTWTEENGLFCNEGTVGSKSVPRTCETLVVDDGKVFFVDQDGTVGSTYTIG